MNIVGIHDGHNASAALLRDGELVAVVQEERITIHEREIHQRVLLTSAEAQAAVGAMGDEISWRRSEDAEREVAELVAAGIPSDVPQGAWSSARGHWATAPSCPDPGRPDICQARRRGRRVHEIWPAVSAAGGSDRREEAPVMTSCRRRGRRRRNTP
jgi:hypothetical protein